LFVFFSAYYNITVKEKNCFDQAPRVSATTVILQECAQMLTSFGVISLQQKNYVGQVSWSREEQEGYRWAYTHMLS